MLINITGGMDLAIDEVMTISSLIQEEAGDEAEIIFGAVHDPALENQIRVTVIATGFDSENDEKVIRGDFRRPRGRTQMPIEPAQPVKQASGMSAQVGMAVGGGGAPLGGAPLGGGMNSLQPVQSMQLDDSMEQPVLQPPPHQASVQVEAVDVRMAASGGGAPQPVLPLTRFPERTVSRDQIEGLDIPTFIRRQMD